MLLDWVLLLPILFPLVGALIGAIIAPITSARLRAWLPIVFIVIEIVLIAVNAAPGTHRLLVSDWTPAAFSIILRLDGVTWLLLLVMIVPLAALWLIAPPRQPFDLLAILVLTGAIFLLTAANLITAYMAWTFLDVAIFLWRLARHIEHETALRGLVIGLLGGLILFAGAILLAAKHPSAGAALVALAFWARLGLFPFHDLLPDHGSDSFDLWFARGLPLIAASNLWLHWSTFNVTAPTVLLGSLAVAALLAALVWIWRASTPASNSDSNGGLSIRAASFCAQGAFALIPLTIALGGDAGMALGLWLTLAAVIALALFEIANRWRADNLNRWHRLIWFAAMLSLAGLPLTPAFVGRVGLYVALWESNNGIVLLLVGVATWVTLAPMWNIGFALKAGELREPRRGEYTGLAVIALASAALALAPTLIAQGLSPAFAASYERALDLIFRTNDVVGVGLSIVTVIVPVLGSYWLSAQLQRLRPQPGALVLRLARLIDLEWLARGLASLGLRIAASARGGAAMAEENPTIWILFAALWIAIFIMLAK